MADADPLRKAARVARRIAGYRQVRRALVPRLRRNRTLRTAAHRIWAVRRPGRGRSVSPSDVTAGTLLAGVGTENLPVVGVLAVGIPAEDLKVAVEQIAAEQLMTAGFRPVFVVDRPDFGPTRRFGYVTELLIDPADWTYPDPYQDYLDRRFVSIQTDYGVRSWLALTAGGITSLQRAQLRGLDGAR